MVKTRRHHKTYKVRETQARQKPQKKQAATTKRIRYGEEKPKKKTRRHHKTYKVREKPPQQQAGYG